MKVYRIGIIGLGYIASLFHLPAWSKLQKCKITYLCDIQKDILRRKGREYRVKNLCRDYKEVLESDNVDIVTISTPTPLHYEHCRAALESGKHVVVEKPFTVKFKEAEELFRLSERNHLSLMCLQHNRFKPETLALKAYINEKMAKEKIYFAKASILNARNVPVGNNYIADHHKGGGPIYDSGCHILDLTWWLMGCPRPESVAAYTWRELGKEKGIKGERGEWNRDLYNCEDGGAALIRFQNGAILSLEVTYLLNLLQNVISCQLFSKNFGIFWPGLSVGRVIGDKLKQSVITVKHKELPSVLQLSHFIQMVDKKERPIIPPLQSAEVIRMLEAIHESAERRRTVYLE